MAFLLPYTMPRPRIFLLTWLQISTSAIAAFSICYVLYELVTAPLNGSKARNAPLTAGSFAEPSAVAKKFRIERFAS